MVLILLQTSQNTQWGTLFRGCDAVVGHKQCSRAWKHIGGVRFKGCHRVIVMDLEALEDRFATNSWPKTAEKTKLLQKLRLVKTVLLLSFFLDDPVVCHKSPSSILKELWYDSSATNHRPKVELVDIKKQSRLQRNELMRFWLKSIFLWNKGFP